jgi:hypothetical protein
MCMGCPDFVEYCDKPGCAGRDRLPDGRPNSYGRLRKFYLDSGDLCEHLQAEHGVRPARDLDQLLRGAAEGGESDA